MSKKEYKKEYKITETSTDNRYYYIETNDNLSDQDVREALLCSSFTSHSKTRFHTESGARGWVGYEDTEYGDDSQVEWEEV